MKKITARQQKIVKIILDEKRSSISDIKKLISENVSQVTLNRDLAILVDNNYLIRKGKARSTHYIISNFYKVFQLINTETYFDKEPDERVLSSNFNFEIFDLLSSISIFTKDEVKYLTELQEKYKKNISTIPPTIYKKEIERLSIELSWKSAQIEGNTYSLLETEQLFKERKEAENKTKEEAVMLLNHKDTLNFMMEYKSNSNKITVRFIEEIHSFLIKDLGVPKNIRNRIVGITGTAYKPLDNDFQIKESLQKMCDIINAKENIFEKALIAIILISYIQPFEDGNKRTGRMVGNAILINNNACPLSYRSVAVLDYKKAVLLFYEQNNLSMFKDLFIDQNKFAVENYFL